MFRNSAGTYIRISVYTYRHAWISTVIQVAEMRILYNYDVRAPTYWRDGGTGRVGGESGGEDGGKEGWALNTKGERTVIVIVNEDAEIVLAPGSK